MTLLLFFTFLVFSIVVCIEAEDIIIDDVIEL